MLNTPIKDTKCRMTDFMDTTMTNPDQSLLSYPRSFVRKSSRIVNLKIVLNTGQHWTCAGLRGDNSQINRWTPSIYSLPILVRTKQNIVRPSRVDADQGASPTRKELVHLGRKSLQVSIRTVAQNLKGAQWFPSYCGMTRDGLITKVCLYRLLSGVEQVLIIVLHKSANTPAYGFRGASDPSEVCEYDYSNSCQTSKDNLGSVISMVCPTPVHEVIA